MQAPFRRRTTQARKAHARAVGHSAETARARSRGKAGCHRQHTALGNRTHRGSAPRIQSLRPACTHRAHPGSHGRAGTRCRGTFRAHHGAADQADPGHIEIRIEHRSRRHRSAFRRGRWGDGKSEVWPRCRADPGSEHRRQRRRSTAVSTVSSRANRSIGRPITFVNDPSTRAIIPPASSCAA